MNTNEIAERKRIKVPTFELAVGFNEDGHTTLTANHGGWNRMLLGDSYDEYTAMLAEATVAFAKSLKDFMEAHDRLGDKGVRVAGAGTEDPVYAGLAGALSARPYTAEDVTAEREEQR